MHRQRALVDLLHTTHNQLVQLSLHPPGAQHKGRVLRDLVPMCRALIEQHQEALPELSGRHEAAIQLVRLSKPHLAAMHLDATLQPQHPWAQHLQQPLRAQSPLSCAQSP